MRNSRPIARDIRVFGVKTQSVDPDLPIRGRYIAMRLTVEVENPPVMGKANLPIFTVRLFVKDGHLAARTERNYPGSGVWVSVSTPHGVETTLQQPILFFLPEHAGECEPVFDDGGAEWGVVGGGYYAGERDATADSAGN